MLVMLTHCLPLRSLLEESRQENGLFDQEAFIKGYTEVKLGEEMETAFAGCKPLFLVH